MKSINVVVCLIVAGAITVMSVDAMNKKGPSAPLSARNSKVTSSKVVTKKKKPLTPRGILMRTSIVGSKKFFKDPMAAYKDIIIKMNSLKRNIAQRKDKTLSPEEIVAFENIVQGFYNLKNFNDEDVFQNALTQIEMLENAYNLSIDKTIKSEISKKFFQIVNTPSLDTKLSPAVDTSSLDTKKPSVDTVSKDQKKKKKCVVQ